MKFRYRETGLITTARQIKSSNKSTSLPKVWTQITHDFLKIDPVFESEQPEVGPYEKVVSTGVEKSEDGKWYTSWRVDPLFVENTFEVDGVETTLTVQDQIDVKVTADNALLEVAERAARDDLLKVTDHYGFSDVTMSTEMKTYRQALREVPQQEGFPNSITWPTKP